MKTKFDKIYVISLITNHDRRKFITYQMNELGLDFEFIYGIDFKSLTYDGSNHKIEYPYTYDNNTSNTAGNYGAAIAHYGAIKQAYEFGYNNILVLEDDICFIKNKDLIFECLNNIPDDADFITYDVRFLDLDNNNDEQLALADLSKINNCNCFYNIPNKLNYLFGSMIYGIMNRETMKLYIDSQCKNLNMSDRVIGLWKLPFVNRYTYSKCICTDQLNIESNFDVFSFIYENIYHKIKKLNVDDFYKPTNFHTLCR